MTGMWLIMATTGTSNVYCISYPTSSDTVTGLFLSNGNAIGPAVGLLSLVLREASEGHSGLEIIVEGQIGTKGSPFNQVYS